MSLYETSHQCYTNTVSHCYSMLCAIYLFVGTYSFNLELVFFVVLAFGQLLCSYFCLKPNGTQRLTMSLLSCMKTRCSILCNQSTSRCAWFSGLRRLGPDVLASNYKRVSLLLSHALVSFVRSHPLSIVCPSK